MGKGRAPCCETTKVKRGPWSEEEDLKLVSFIHKYGHENWRSLPTQAGLLRCGKSCRLRWLNYLRPDIKRGNFTPEEEATIYRLHQSLGNKWSKIAAKLPGRTDNEIKNVWHTNLKKRLRSSTGLNAGEEASPKGSLNEVETSPEPSPNVSISLVGSNNSSKEDDVQKDQAFEFTEDYSECMGMLQEVDKPELLEIPFHLDPEVWSFMDDLDQFQQPENSLTSGDPQESEEDEVGKWFNHLEIELGLEENDNQEQEQKQGTRDEEEPSPPSLMESFEFLLDP
ncbi:unnamed protein product [Microthlaspi erraticum]|uniref:Uncharacterized protein n=1 Tax=Microthlaspi erraticum TaxID=1685480 RepID=A0A6D2KX24_9BRAS|nr:unnamed protein product [Microthlaspi erraticum]